MKARNSIAFVLMLLVSAGAMAEGGKQRGDEGQGSVVQNQVRKADPPVPWGTLITLPLVVPDNSETLPDDVRDDEFEEWF